ncbi:ATP-binding cassette domain-containing protein [Streptomyces sp. NPDC057686]|uniref:ATP-binding cassette domain-containing protein n=1 Tax=Streptomyces sp. NPDC057686 TaxID=3346212 RepID=UPI00368AE89E
MTTTEPIPALLRANGLRKTYRTGGTEVVAVDGPSFSLPPGGALGVVGESGSGKSTTARMLVGLEAPDAAAILVQGRPLEKAARGKAARLARAKAVQIVFQDPYLSLEARIGIGATLDGVLRLHGSHDRTARAARVGLGDREAAALPRHLSGGQRQRAAIARALAVEPAVLVLDEAASALDVSVRAQVLNLLADIRRDTGIGLVFARLLLASVPHPGAAFPENRGHQLD